MMENLKTEKMILETTRNQFLNANKKWLQMTINEILTPRTIILNKEKIIEVLQQKFGKKKLPSFEREDEHIMNTEEDKTIILSMTRKAVDVLNLWKLRARLNKYLKDILKLVMAQSKKPRCIKCKGNAGLRCICKSNLYSLFNQYMKTTNVFDELDFKIFFKNKAKLVTICSQCELELR